MADTTFIKKEIEPYVRKWLGGEFPGHRFDEKPVSVGESTEHKFDAVAKDGTIVGDILTSRARTRTGRENTGAVRKACNDVELLNKLPPGKQRVLVFTDGDFCALIKKRANRHGLGQIQMLVCRLPDNLQRQLTKVLDDASAEQRSAHDSD